MIVIKAGGSAITDKRIYARTRPSAIRRLALELSGTDKAYLLVNGAGSFGHKTAKKHGLNRGYREEGQRKGACKTRLDVTRLNMIIVKAMINKGINAISVSPSSSFVCEKGRIRQSFLAPACKMIDMGFVPVFFGDVVFDRKTGFSILSGDQIAVYLALKFKAERLILATDVDGLYDGDPKTHREARFIPRVRYGELGEMVSRASEVGDVTGGMGGKLREILALRGRGVETDIVNLRRKGALADAMEGRISGTRIME